MNTKEWEKEFDKQFVDTEGCQAAHEDDKCLHCNVSPCPHCKRWGGKEGEPKYSKRPTASSGSIKAFLHSTIKDEVARALEGVSIRGYKEDKDTTLYALGYNDAVDAMEEKKKEIMKLYD